MAGNGTLSNRSARRRGADPPKNEPGTIGAPASFNKISRVGQAPGTASGITVANLSQSGEEIFPNANFAHAIMVPGVEGGDYVTHTRRRLGVVVV